MSRFSQLYALPAELQPDSKRLRLRLAAVFDALPISTSVAIQDEMKRRVGARFGGGWDHWFIKAELRDVLDAVTIGYLVVPLAYNRTSDRDQAARFWKAEMRTILAEERVRYRLDDDCIVHFAVDEEFEAARVSALSKLNRGRYRGVRAAFEQAYDALGELPPNGKLALRGVFEALEIGFKLFYPRAARLGGTEIRQHLEPAINARYAGDQTALRAAQKLKASFIEWVDGVHFYRHGQGEEEPAQPPIELAVLGVSQGTAFLRWLLDFDPVPEPAQS